MLSTYKGEVRSTIAGIYNESAKYLQRLGPLTLPFGHILRNVGSLWSPCGKIYYHFKGGYL
jgi:hypothetical protein